MGVYTFTIVDKSSQILQPRLFKAIFLDNHNVLPKAIPQNIMSMELAEGDSTVVGCVKKTTFADGKYMMTKLEELDMEKCSFKYTSFESDMYGDVPLESVVYEGQVNPLNEGSHYKLVGHFHTKGDVVLKREDVTFRLQGAIKTFDVVNQYLIDNPDFYT